MKTNPINPVWPRFLARCLFVTGLSLAVLPAAAGEPLFEWFGDEIDSTQQYAPEIVKGDLGELEELQFSASNPNDEPGDEGSFLSVPLPAGPLDELTIAFFIKPERRGQNEDIVSCKIDAEKLGFRLRKNWMRWGFDVGDGGQAVFTNSDREADLTMNEWQHLAVTFNRGEIIFFKDGVLAGKQTVPVKQIILDPKSPLRIGAGPGIPPRLYDPFAGRLGGIYISDAAASKEQIHQLLSRGTR